MWLIILLQILMKQELGEDCTEGAHEQAPSFTRNPSTSTWMHSPKGQRKGIIQSTQVERSRGQDPNTRTTLTRLEEERKLENIRLNTSLNPCQQTTLTTRELTQELLLLALLHRLEE